MNKMCLASLPFLFFLLLPFNAWSQAGCTDNEACNFDPNAVVNDGTCAYIVDCAGACGGNFIQDLCGNCYDPNAVNGILDFVYSGGLQYWTVPDGVTEIIIDAWGAEGGTSTGQNGGQNFIGGRGAHVQGTFSVNPGEVFEILVGQKGANGSCGSGGGGGSFVVFNGTPLAIAGGGGGGFHCNVLGGNPGGNGLVSTNGGDGIPPPAHPSPYYRPARPGGTNGNGGSSYFGGGGGGWLSAGITNAGGPGGGAYPGAGGGPGGGYGGGGAYYSGCCGGSGGGGGYSGGSGGESDGCAGGGGGSWNAGFNQLNESGVRLGDGLVSIRFADAPVCLPGCTNPIAQNYDPDANFDDGSCLVPGCTDPNAENYNPQAFQDDGSCIYAGCTYPGAVNFDPQATLDDGSCEFPAVGCGPGTYYDEISMLCLPLPLDCPSDINGDGLVNTLDLLGLLADFGTSCQ